MLRQKLERTTRRSKATITRCDLSPDSFVLMLRYCANLKAIRYESTSLKPEVISDRVIRKYCTLKNELIKKSCRLSRHSQIWYGCVFILKSRMGRIFAWATPLITLLKYLVDLLLKKKKTNYIKRII